MALFRRRQRRSEHAEPEATAEAVEAVSAPSGPEDELEGSELAKRLRRLDWPHPPEDVRERCLQQIMQRVEHGSDRSVATDGSDSAA